MNTAAGPIRLAPRRLSDQLAAVIQAHVADGSLAVGDRLPTEQQLAQAYGVSRTVVREAVHQLKSQGLLRSRQGSGVFVDDPGQRPLAFDASVLESIDAVVQVVEVRRALEGEIAALAAERASRSQVAAMNRALKALDAAVAAGGDGVAEDLAFHHTVAQACGNPQFARLLGFVEQHLREAMRVTRGNEARRRDFADAVRAEHLAVVHAIAAGDVPAARAAAVQHMQHAAARLVAAGVVKPAAAARPVRRKPT